MSSFALTAPPPSVRTSRASSVAITGRLLHERARREGATLMAFLRRFDRAADPETRGSAAAERAIEQGETFVAALASGRSIAGIVDQVILPEEAAADFALLAKRHALPTQPLASFFDGLRDDLAFREPDTDADLDRYCYRVAGSVGVLMAWLLGVREAEALEHAATLARAMQLTNVLRDVEEDLGNGRIYLPRRVRATFGVDRALLATAPFDPRVRALRSLYTQRARALYASALPGVDAIPGFRSRAFAGAVARVHRGILDEIEARDFALLGRARVSSPRRIGLVLSALLATRLWRRPCS